VIVSKLEVRSGKASVVVLVVMIGSDEENDDLKCEVAVVTTGLDSVDGVPGPITVLGVGVK
jgi:hypothetical protein